MVLKPDQQRIKDLLSETITLLCRSGLHFKSEFSIEALIGITLDQEDVFLVSIKETVHTGESWNRSESWVDHRNSDVHRDHNTRHHGVKDQTGSVADAWSRRQTDSSVDERLVLNQDYDTTFLSAMNLQKAMPEPARSSNHKRLRKDPAPKIYPQLNASVTDVDGDDLVLLEDKTKRQRLSDPLGAATFVNDGFEPNTSKGDSKLPSENSSYSNRTCSSSRSYADKTCRIEDITTVGEDPALDSNNLPKTEGITEADECNGASVNSETNPDKVSDETDPGSDKEENLKSEYVTVKDEPGDDAGAVFRRRPKLQQLYGQAGGFGGRVLGGKKYGSRGATVGIMHPLAIQQVEPNLPPLWQLPASQESAQSVKEKQPWMGGGLVAPADPEAQHSMQGDGPPNMTREQAMMVVEVLSISGSFINIGSAKAFQHNLRKLTKNELSEVLEKMTVPATSKYCVGLLCTEGASRVFYKIPPPLIKEEALSFYNMDLAVYSNLYYGPVRVPHNVKEPYEWRCMLEMKSPFNMMAVENAAFQ